MASITIIPAHQQAWKLLLQVFNKMLHGTLMLTGLWGISHPPRRPVARFRHLIVNCSESLAHVMLLSLKHGQVNDIPFSNACPPDAASRWAARAVHVRAVNFQPCTPDINLLFSAHADSNGEELAILRERLSKPLQGVAVFPILISPVRARGTILLLFEPDEHVQRVRFTLALELQGAPTCASMLLWPGNLGNPCGYSILRPLVAREERVDFRERAWIALTRSVAHSALASLNAGKQC
jgi:hypothetical protein